jgi:hypothetical protein
MRRTSVWPIAMIPMYDAVWAIELMWFESKNPGATIAPNTSATATKT